MRLFPLAAVGVCLCAALAQAATADQILGTWLTPNGQSKVEFTACGDEYCGAVVWMETPRRDERNEDKSLRERDLVGVRVASGFRFKGKDTWEGGRVYAPARGRLADAQLVLTSDDTLEVRASVGMVRRTVVWTRVKK